MEKRNFKIVITHKSIPSYKYNNLVNVLETCRSYKDVINELMKPYIEDYNNTRQEAYEQKLDDFKSGKLKSRPKKSDYKIIDLNYFDEHVNDVYYNTKTHEKLPKFLHKGVIIDANPISDEPVSISFDEFKVNMVSLSHYWSDNFPAFKLLGMVAYTKEDGGYGCYIHYFPLSKKEDGAAGLSVSVSEETALKAMGFEPEIGDRKGGYAAPIRFNAFRNRLYKIIDEIFGLTEDLNEVSIPACECEEEPECECNDRPVCECKDEPALVIELVEDSKYNEITPDKSGIAPAIFGALLNILPKEFADKFFIVNDENPSFISEKIKKLFSPAARFYDEHFMDNSGSEEYLDTLNLFKTYYNPFISLNETKDFLKEVKNKPKCFYQRLKFGVCNSDVKNLDNSCAAYIANALKMFIDKERDGSYYDGKILHSYENETLDEWYKNIRDLSEEWKNYITRESRAFDIISNNKTCDKYFAPDYDESKEKNSVEKAKAINSAMDLAFAEISEELDEAFRGFREIYDKLWL